MNIPIGHLGEKKTRVTADIAINFLGTSDGQVLATPHLISYLEFTARDSIKDLLEAGFDSVGTDVSVRHLGSTPVGMEITFRSEVIKVDGRRVTFRVEAADSMEKVCEGTHERFVVNVERFGARNAEKRRKGGLL